MKKLPCFLTILTAFLLAISLSACTFSFHTNVSQNAQDGMPLEEPEEHRQAVEAGLEPYIAKERLPFSIRV